MPVSVPLPGPVATAKVRSSPSGSVAVRTIGSGVVSDVWAAWSLAVGGWLAAMDSVESAQRGSAAPSVVPSSHIV